LTYLRKLPVDSLKIDQSFVRDMLTDLEDHGIVEAVIRLATALDRQVIAEGVESLAHGAALLKLGCTLAQGYGIARPMPGSDVLAWAEQWTAQRAWETVSTVPS
jgi:EAL domain-containing protein (putative c-di-GMP-specific phosphodiesterase class I)